MTASQLSDEANRLEGALKIMKPIAIDKVDLKVVMRTSAAIFYPTRGAL